MNDNILEVTEEERGDIAIVEIEGADRPKGGCPYCGRLVPAFELTKLDEATAELRGVAFACGHCLTQWEREGE